MKALVAVSLICGITAAVITGLWSIKDSHIGFTNVCMEWLHPDTCGRSAKQTKD